MAELPGWDRGRLATASAQDLEAARWIVYARAWTPTVRQNIDAQIEGLEGDIRAGEISKLTGDSHRVAAARQVDAGIRRLRELIEDLRGAKGHQADIRRTLELDEPEPPIARLEDLS